MSDDASGHTHYELIPCFRAIIIDRLDDFAIETIFFFQFTVRCM